jgi:hypothetical protein
MQAGRNERQKVLGGEDDPQLDQNVKKMTSLPKKSKILLLDNRWVAPNWESVPIYSAPGDVGK